MVVSALAGSAATLTTLHGLPLGVAQRDRPHPGLAAFTQLRALTLQQMEARPKALRAAHLPASLEQLTLATQADEDGDYMHRQLPALGALNGLTRLRRLSLAGFEQFWMRTEDGAEGYFQQIQFPQSLEVHTMIPCSEQR